MAEDEAIEAENQEKEQKKDKKKQYLSETEYEIGKLRRDIEEFKDKVLDKFIEIKTEMKTLRAQNNASGSRLNGYTIKELGALKSLGINPKDLLTGKPLDIHGEKEKS